MIRVLIACAGMLFPLAGMGCEYVDTRACKKQLAELVSYRSEAMTTAFGDLRATLPAEIQIRFVTSKDPEYAKYNGRVAYDAAQQTLLIPRRFFAAKMPNPLRAAVYYWPFYQNDLYRESFPLVQAIDNALWGAYLQEAARSRGLSWPHAECVSVDIGKRLPCEMLVEGIAEHLTESRTQIFNSNRLDRIWPEDFARFKKNVWVNDPEYQEVLRYGGILLIRPLINEFGVQRTLAYVAKTPFRVEGDNLRLAAMHYQDRAREALNLGPVNSTVATSDVVRDGAWRTTSLRERASAE